VQHLRCNEQFAEDFFESALRRFFAYRFDFEDRGRGGEVFVCREILKIKERKTVWK
jgi:hypothetical protein